MKKNKSKMILVLILLLGVLLVGCRKQDERQENIDPEMKSEAEVSETKAKGEWSSENSL